MSDGKQTVVSRSFVELFMPDGAVKPRQPREVILARHELCEDMAQMLIEHAKTKLWQLGVTEPDVLERIHRGLGVQGSVVETDEARGITCRLAELLGWSQPSPVDAAIFRSRVVWLGGCDGRDDACD